MRRTTNMEVGAVPRGARRRAATHASILDAAEHLFGTAPMGAVRIEDIAEAADVSVGSVYVHFGSKDGVLREVAERGVERAAEHLASAFAVSAEPIEQFAEAGRTYLRFLVDNPVFLRYLTADSSSQPTVADEVAGPWIDTLRSMFEDRIRAAIAAGQIQPVDPRLMAHFLFGAWNGVAALGLRNDSAALSRADVEACLEQARQVVVAGLRVGAAR